MNYPKRVYPHIYEYQKLGGDSTLEGQVYMIENQKQIDKEYSDAIDGQLLRQLRGNHNYVHKITKDEHI